MLFQFKFPLNCFTTPKPNIKVNVTQKLNFALKLRAFLTFVHLKMMKLGNFSMTGFYYV